MEDDIECYICCCGQKIKTLLTYEGRIKSFDNIPKEIKKLCNYSDKSIENYNAYWDIYRKEKMMINKGWYMMVFNKEIVYCSEIYPKMGIVKKYPEAVLMRIGYEI